jgi:hypothetical protein
MATQEKNRLKTTVDESLIEDIEAHLVGYIPDKVVHRIWGKMEKN